MRYNVAQLLKEPIGATRRYQVEETYTENIRIADMVAGPVRMLRTHQGLLVHADLDIQKILNCSRCLTEFGWYSTLHIEEEFFPTIDLHAGRRQTSSLGDEDTSYIDTNQVLDLTEIMRQYSIAELPMKPLCQRDCSGLCLQCGANLNQSVCDCDADQRDPRWGALAELLNLRKS